ncbi:MAG: hypothetical protein OEY44_00050 [Candidatus Peregrinibacteria bacterium]|nr:hypothetical protein [Candidatus Peregrinibacteria bacterium]
MRIEEKIIVIVGITEALKQYGIPSSFAPSVAILTGAAVGYAEYPDAQGILEGAILGAVVAGFYALAKRLGRAALSPFRRPPDFRAQEHDDDRGL